ncbi:MAG: hypothetical protein NC414_11715, partial [Bacteroidales bacterium]|nr:hypothetical protein [Bacteroidales bacterium]
MVKICDRDPSHTETRIIPTTKCAHNWSEWSKLACQEQGTVTRTCTKCGVIDKKEMFVDHDWGEWVIDVQVVPHNTDGKRHRVCKLNSAHVEEEIIDAHDLEFVEHIGATCTEGGYDLYKCTVCDEEIKKNETDPLGHDMPDEWTVRKSAVCNNDGSITEGEEVKICRRCTVYEETRPITTTHDIQKTLVNTEVINPGDDRISSICEIEHYAYVCTKCGYEEKTEDKNIGHNWEKDSSGNLVWKTIEEASHGHDGMQINTCLNHSEHIQNKSIPMPDDHVFTEKLTDVPCSYDPETKIENKGHRFTELVCTVCGEIETTSDLEIIEHQFGEWTTIKESTCTEDGIIERTCSVCGYPEREFVGAKGHTWGEPYNNGAASCYDAGAIMHKCTVCGLVEPIDDVKPLGHDLDDGINPDDSSTWPVVKQATCTEEGKREAVCKRDSSHRWSAPIPATGHTYEKTGDKAATCTEPASETYKCTVCGDTYSKYIGQPLGHIWGEPENDGNPETHIIDCERDSSHVKERANHEWDDGKITKAATCEENGEKTYTCTVCGFKRVEPIPAIGHNWDDGVIDPDSNCTDEGIKTYTCKNDSSHKYTEAVSPKGHKPGEAKEENRKEAACTEKGGYDTVVRCTVCDAVLESTHTDIDPLGHDYGAWTDDENGVSHTKTCQRDICDETVSEHKKIANHKIKETDRVEPTCTKDGYIEYTCSECGYTYQTPLEMTGHNYGDWKTVTPATCTETGEEQRICKNDSSHVETREISATGHAYGDWKTVTAPTCTEDGEKQRVCKNDAAHVETETISKLGHDWSGEWEVTKKATRDEQGEETLYCKNDRSHKQTRALDWNYFVVTFVANNEVVDEVVLEKGKGYTKVENEPKVPEAKEDRFEKQGKWEEYTLSDVSITVYAEYDLIKPEPNDIITEKTATIDPETDVATINLSAASKGKTIIDSNSEAVPLDIVMVIDQSGSMAWNLNGNETTIETDKRITEAKKA